MKFFDLFRTGEKIVLSDAAMDGSRPVLTVGQAEKLLGDKIDHMVLYDLETCKPLKSVYNDQKVIYDYDVSYCANALKDMYAHSIGFKNKKPMWVAAKSVASWEGNGYHLLKSKTKYNACGLLIVGNVIFYDMKQKKYTTLYQNGDWIRVGVKDSYRAASKESILNTFVTLCTNYIR